MLKYKLFMIDLDGTMYRGTEKIEEAPEFIQQLHEQHVDYLFLTNNSSKKPEEIVTHLASFGIKTEVDKVYTSSMATAEYVSEQMREARVFIIGEEGLQAALKQKGCQLVTMEEDPESCDYVIMGIDRQISYDKLAFGTLAVRAGATFISTNADKALPTEKGLLPGNGSITSVISTATGVEPIFIGKPEPYMVQMIMDKKGLHKEDLLMIGDNYETDIMTGIRSGVDSAIVFTGYTSKEDLKRYEHPPTYLWNSLLDWK